MAARRPRDIGTAAETAVVRYLRGAGWPHAERRALRGHADAGDITGTPGLAWSVKGGTAAKTASDGLIESWLGEVEKQKANAGAAVAILVVQRAGIGPANAGRWWAIMSAWQYEAMCAAASHPDEPDLGRWRFGSRAPLRMHLHHACALLNYAGYGDPK